MSRPQEYSLAALIEHPALGVMMKSAGIERRSLDLMLDTEYADRRQAQAERRELGIFDQGR